MNCQSRQKYISNSVSKRKSIENGLKMLLIQLQKVSSFRKICQVLFHKRFSSCSKVLATPQEVLSSNESTARVSIEGTTMTEIFPATTSSVRVIPLMLPEREAIVLPFDEMPGPNSLKLLAKGRQYLSGLGTQITASFLTLGVNLGSFVKNKQSANLLSALFDEYGPVVRFVSPVGGDIVLLNNPDHIQKVFASEGGYPVRSTLDCLEKYRTEHKKMSYAGLFNLQGAEWQRKRVMLSDPLNSTIVNHFDGFEDVCDSFVNKVYNQKNSHDELSGDLHKEIYKWAFDCMGYLIFSKKFTMLDTEIVYSQCDMSWLYRSFEKSTEAILKCESGLQMWKIVPTFAWKSLVKHCESLDNLIGKYILEAEQKLIIDTNENKAESLINCLLLNEAKLSSEDISTILMDMLLIGVNTISSATSFLLYFLAKHQNHQRKLYQEIQNIDKFDQDWDKDGFAKLKTKTYLRACMRETLRLVPPIPLLSRVLPRNVTLDRYNIPRGTLILMSMQDAALKESNFDDAKRFDPERWIKPESKDYHAFATIPFGFGARKCVGQNVAETMMALLCYKLLRKFKLEYHYGDINPTKTFIVKPDKPLKIRFIDRME